MFEQLNFFVSFFAGVISFLSPCVFPLVPSFLLYLSGSTSAKPTTTGANGAAPMQRRLLVVRTLFFISGFILLFVILGYVFSSAGILLGRLSVVINIVAGSIVVLLGIHQIFNIFRFLQFEAKIRSLSKVGGNMSAFIAGVAFGAGWSPCIGPLLTSILLLASQSSDASVGIVYLSLYGLGLGAPFVLIAASISAQRMRAFLNRYTQRIKRAGGVMLIVIGLLIIFGRFRVFNSALARWGRALHDIALHRPTTALWIGASAYLILTAWFVYRLIRAAVGRGGRALRSRSLRMGIHGGLAAVCTTLFVLELVGTINTVELVSRWFQFQGV